MAYVYWVRLPAHTDVRTQGYIGVTVKSVDCRFSEHLRSSLRGSELCVHRAIRKHGSAVEVVALLEGSEDYCYLMENRLRPVPGIGWNMNAGGNEAPRTGVKLSEATVQKLRYNNLGKTLPDSWRAALSRAAAGKPKSADHAASISASLTGKPKSASHVRAMSAYMKAKHEGVGAWEYARANKLAWSQARQIYDYMAQFPGHGSLKVAGAFALQRSDVATLHKDIRAGWNPHEDEAYQKWLSSYKESLHDSSAQPV